MHLHGMKWKRRGTGGTPWAQMEGAGWSGSPWCRMEGHGLARNTLELKETAWNQVDQPGGRWHMLEVMDFPAHQGLSTAIQLCPC